jgi:hypothetical protein
LFGLDGGRRSRCLHGGRFWKGCGCRLWSGRDDWLGFWFWFGLGFGLGFWRRLRNGLWGHLSGDFRSGLYGGLRGGGGADELDFDTRYSQRQCLGRGAVPQTEECGEVDDGGEDAGNDEGACHLDFT